MVEHDLTSHSAGSVTFSDDNSVDSEDGISTYPHRSFTRIISCDPDPRDPDSVKATLSVICPDTPGMLAGIARWLCHDVKANIVSSFGGRMDGDVHGSFFTIRTRNEQLGAIIHEVNMRRCDELNVGRPPDREEMKVYELTVTAPDEPGIFCKVADVLTKDNRRVNILSQSIVTKRYPETPDCPYAHIRLRLEVPPETVLSLPRMIDEIRERGDGEWLVFNREPNDGDTVGKSSMLGMSQLN